MTFTLMTTVITGMTALVCMRKQVMVLINSYQIETISHQRLNKSRRPSGLRKTKLGFNSLAHRTTWLRSDFLGARRVLGLDLSDESLRRARNLAKKAGASIDFIEGNVYDAREVIVGDFDLIYTSLGVLCWLPDITAWGRVVASLLKSGGKFIIRDDHPMFMTIGEDVRDGFKIEQPYFEQSQPMTWEDEGSYIETDASLEKIKNTRNHQWNHALSEIIMALINAGLQIDLVSESQHAAWNIWPHLMEKCSDGSYRLKKHSEVLPLQFLISAHKPEA